MGIFPDEVLRLSQFTGLAEAFAVRDFSRAWDAVLDVDDEGRDITHPAEMIEEDFADVLAG